MKLTHTPEKQFPQTHLSIETILDECLKTLFPNEVYILENMKNISRKDKTFTMSYNKGFLAYHSSDNNWLAHYLELAYAHLQSVKNARTGNSINSDIRKIPFGYIRQYVERSPKFEASRSQYEQNLVGAYIQLTQDFQKDDFYAKSFVKVADFNHPQYERLLRDRFVGAMKHLGMDAHSIEVGIEANAYRWRPNARVQTFINNYRDYDLVSLLGQKGSFAKNQPQQWVKLMNAAEKLFMRWSAFEDFNYYKEYGAVIDQLGLATPNMIINEKEAAKLEQEVESMRFTFECLMYEATQDLSQFVNKNQNKVSKIENSMGLI